MHRALPPLVVLAVTLVLAACGGDDEQPASTASERTTTEATSPDAPSGEVETQAAVPEEFADGTGEEERADEPGAAPAAGRKARRTCLRGSWVSSSFDGRRSVDSPFGQIGLSGRGRGIGLSFEGRRWTFRGVGQRPMRGRALGIKGTLKVNGSARGRLVAVRSTRVRFRQTGTRGTVTLAGLGSEFELPVSVVAAAIVPDGPAKVRCGGGRLVIDSRSGVLRMTR